MLQPGGTIAFSTWIEREYRNNYHSNKFTDIETAGWIAIAREAIKRMPGNLPFFEPEQFLTAVTDGKWHSKPWIESQLEERGFQDIDVRPTTIKLALACPVFVEMTMLALPMVMKSFWNEKQQEENQDKLRPALEKYVEDTYGNGTMDTDWVAILSTARKSS